MKYIKKYEQFKKQINISKNILVDDYTANKEFLPMDLESDVLEMSLEDIELDFDVSINEDNQELIPFSGSALCWRYTNDDFIYGGFKINGLWDSLVLDSDFWKVNFSLGPSDEVPEELKHFEQLNWIEKQSWGDDGRFGCFIREKGTFPPRMAFFDTNWYTELSLTMEEYFDALFASCAVKGWQYFYIDWNQDIPHKQQALADMELAVKYLPSLFPDQDFRYHLEKLKEVKSILQ